MPGLQRSRIRLVALITIATLPGCSPLTVQPAGGPAATSAVGPQQAQAVPHAAGKGTARLSWNAVAPAAYGDGAAADPIAGFRVYVGTSPEALRLEATIADPTATGYVVTRLPKGRFYYSVTTYTRLGIESQRSTPVSKTIR